MNKEHKVLREIEEQFIEEDRNKAIKVHFLCAAVMLVIIGIGILLVI